MNSVDFIVVVIIALTTFSSMRAGIIKEAMTLVGFVVGIYVALGYYQRVAAWLNPSIGNPTLANAIAFILILFVVWVLAAFVAGALRAALCSLGLGWTDNAIGMVVGFLVGLFLSVCFLLLLARLPIPVLNEAVRDSSLASYIFLLLPYLQQLLPPDLRLLRILG